jgi:hypothetical protein
MMKKTLILNSAALFAATSLIAGPAPILDPVPTPVATADDSLGFELSVGYDTKYIFRGVDFGDHLIWAGLDYELELSEGLSLGLGTWFGSLAEDSYNELNLIGGLSYDAGPVTLGVGYTHYLFLYDNEDAAEVNGTLGFGAGPLDIELGYYYDFEVEGSYLELAIGAEFALTERIAIAPGAVVAYNFDYYTDATDWNHIGVSLGFPITLTSTATLTPYVAANFPLDAISGTESDEIFGGVALSVSF